MSRWSGNAKFGVVAAALAASVLAACGGSDSGKPASASLQLEPCVASGIAARCGTLSVPQDRSVSGGPKIAVRVVVIPAQGSARQPDPVVWFSGGPGDSAVDMIGRVRPLLGSTDRDLVFIEQRGTGASNVTCKALPDLADQAALRDAVTSCLRGLTFDLRAYSTEAFTDDVDDVLTALHYDPVNLVGISYGATAEQVFLARHPARVRTMTLLGGTLLTVPVFERMPASRQRALDGVFAECARDPACAAAFPHLRAEWASLWQSINQHPWVVPAERSPTHQPVVLGADWMANAMERLLVIESTQVDIPVAVHTLATSPDRIGALTAVNAALPATPDPATTIQVLLMATRCAEPWAREVPTNVAGAGSFDYRRELASAQKWQYVCSLVPGAHTPSPAALPVNPRVAVLALNGMLDPQDPPANMAGAQAIWPKGLFLQVPGQGHDIDDQTGTCVAPMLQSFVRRGAAAGLDTSCLQQLTRRTFPLTLDAVGSG